MDKMVKDAIDNLGSNDDKIRLTALETILKITDDEVDWVYDVWDDLIKKLDHENSFQRNIAIMLLCNLAKSDSENRMEGMLQSILAHTRDNKFVTSRKCLQYVWKLAVVNTPARKIVVAHLEKQYESCIEGKHYNLIRQDIIYSLRQIVDHDGDGGLLTLANELVKKEKEEKYRKRYETILKDN